MKVASTADAELLVISAMMFSKIDLSVAKLVSSIPLIVRLVDIIITTGVSRKSKNKSIYTSDTDYI